MPATDEVDDLEPVAFVNLCLPPSSPGRQLSVQLHGYTIGTKLHPLEHSREDTRGRQGLYDPLTPIHY